MPNEIIGLIGLLLMFILMFSRVPLVSTLAIIGFLGAIYFRGLNALGTALTTIVWDNSFSYTFSAIPMFVFMGELLYTSGVTSNLFDTFRRWFGHLKGGLAMATIGSSAIFAAASGSSLANTGTMGVIAYKEMKKSGYDDKVSTGSILAGGSLGILIPPSTVFIIYGLLTEQSIGRLFIAGIIPGILLTIFLMATIYVWVTLKPGIAPRSNKSKWGERFSSIFNVGWILALFTLVIGGLFLGLFSPTEASGIGAFGALIITFLRGKLNFKSLITALERALRTTGFIFAIVLGAFILNYFLALSHLPDYMAQIISNSNLSPLTVIFIIILMYIILGCVMDTLAMIVITMPFVLPVIEVIGYDFIWFGVLIVLLYEMAQITPPLGLLTFVLSGVLKNVKIETIFKGGLIIIIPIAVLIVLLVFFPDIALFLPDLMHN